MKYIKKYENIHTKPQVGDYVMINPTNFAELESFFSNEIGVIEFINTKELEIKGYPYYVRFKNKIPASTFGQSTNEMAFKENEFLGWSNNLSELKITIKSKKYNL